MTELTEADIAAGVAPKSKQITADDLIVCPVTVTINKTTLHEEDEKSPWWLDVEEYPKKPFKPCLSMRRLMLEIMGGNPKRWTGQRLTLYRDPQVKFKGDTVGGVRISHFSALTEVKKVTLRTSKTRTIEWVACPLESQPPPTTATVEELEYVTETIPLLMAAETMEELMGYGDTIKTKSQAIQDGLRPTYVARYSELKTSE